MYGELRGGLCGILIGQGRGAREMEAWGARRPDIQGQICCMWVTTAVWIPVPVGKGDFEVAQGDSG